jgi:hypothetical protein
VLQLQAVDSDGAMVRRVETFANAAEPNNHSFSKAIIWWMSDEQYQSPKQGFQISDSGRTQPRLSDVHLWQSQ